MTDCVTILYWKAIWLGSLKESEENLKTNPISFTLTGASVSILREHQNVGGSGGQCSSESVLNPSESHRVEKRSYLPPVTCSAPHEQGAIRSKIHCQPRPRVVRLPWPNDTSVHQVRIIEELLNSFDNPI